MLVPLVADDGPALRIASEDPRSVQGRCQRHHVVKKNRPARGLVAEDAFAPVGPLINPPVSLPTAKFNQEYAATAVPDPVDELLLSVFVSAWVAQRVEVDPVRRRALAVRKL